jgi:hypothetical protein
MITVGSPPFRSTPSSSTSPTLRLLCGAASDQGDRGGSAQRPRPVGVRGRRAGVGPARRASAPESVGAHSPATRRRVVSRSTRCTSGVLHKGLESCTRANAKGSGSWVRCTRQGGHAPGLLRHLDSSSTTSSMGVPTSRDVPHWHPYPRLPSRSDRGDETGLHDHRAVEPQGRDHGAALLHQERDGRFIVATPELTVID